MPARRAPAGLYRLLLVSFLLLVLPMEQVSAQRSKSPVEVRQLSPQQAASKAQAQYGGRVLKVSRQKNGYRVKLLLDSGKVITVIIGD